MKSLGIIAEFNPFHEGHKYIIEQAKKDTGADVCVVVMSGNFVQRGFPAVYDKWSRAEEAVNQGANLVVELPAVFACNSAEYFAQGGVELLEGFGCIDYIAFGSEAGELEPLQNAAAFLSRADEAVKVRIQQLMREGYAHPKARQIAVLEMEKDFDDDLIREPNNILAIEYLQHIRTLKPHTVKRKGAGYHESASALREEMRAKDPAHFAQIYDCYWRLTAAKVLQTDIETLMNVFSADAGLAHKLKKEIRYAASMDELIDRMKSKVYTRTRISRLLTQLLLGITDSAVQEAASYIRVLAFDEKGARFLKTAKKAEGRTLPILTNINKDAVHYPEIQQTLEIDILASDLYHLLCGKNLYDYADYVKRPYGKL